MKKLLPEFTRPVDADSHLLRILEVIVSVSGMQSKKDLLHVCEISKSMYMRYCGR
jgi:hypothetical protein